MNRLHTGIAVIFSFGICLLPTGVANAEWLFNWSSLDGGNDHWYKLVMSNQTWDDSRSAAENDSLFGMSGHLVTVTSLAEHQFIERSFASLLLPPMNQPGDIVWIGLTDRAVEGEYRWITGESFTFDAWWPGEPNNSMGGYNPEGEDVVHYQAFNGQALGWNDHPGYGDPVYGGPFPGTRWGYIAEFESAAVPAPSSLACLVGVGVTFGCLGWWKRYRWGRRRSNEGCSK